MIDDFRPRKRPDKPAPDAKPTVEDKQPPPEHEQNEPYFDGSSPSLAEIDSETFEPKKRSIRWQLGWPPTRNQAIVAVVVCVLVLGGGAFAFLHHRSTPVAQRPVPVPAVKRTPTPQPIVSALTGLPVSDASVNARPVTGVMIENSVEARPQSGLSQAGVVFEAIAEGGITRFLALFQDQQPDNIGPIRSVRPYYIQWAMSFDAPLAHVGGSPEALQDMKSWGARDLDQFANGSSYHRVSTRAAPHNVYTALATLNQLEQKKGFAGSTFTSFPRKADEPSKQPNATSVDFKISSALYNVHYDYDKGTNSYKRSEGGKPHVDANSNAQITPKVVIALVVPYNLESDNKHSQYGTIGSGAAYVFQDGSVTQGAWSKADDKSQITFSDSSGNPIKLNAGQTWISVVSDSTKVVYKP